VIGGKLMVQVRLVEALVFPAPSWASTWNVWLL